MRYARNIKCIHDSVIVNKKVYDYGIRKNNQKGGKVIDIDDVLLGVIDILFCLGILMASFTFVVLLMT